MNNPIKNSGLKVVGKRIRNFSYKKYFGTPLLSNVWFYLAIISSTFLQLMIMYTPLNKLFKVAPLSFENWAIILGACIISGFILYLNDEVVKRFFRSEIIVKQQKTILMPK